jgi:hypothetical protein
MVFHKMKRGGYFRFFGFPADPSNFINLAFELWVKKSSNAVSVIRNSKRVSIIGCIGKPIWMITSKELKKSSLTLRNSL